MTEWIQVGLVDNAAASRGAWATYSADKAYRYSLGRLWDIGKPSCAFIMLNPSTATEFEDDPTIRRCIGFAKSWGYGSFEVGNLFAYRATDPRKLERQTDPIGAGNDEAILRIQSKSKMTILAWGNKGALKGRDRQVALLLARKGPCAVLGFTGQFQPKHPLYVRGDARPEPVTADLLEYIGMTTSGTAGKCAICGKFARYVRAAGCCSDCCDLEPGHGHRGEVSP